MKHTVAHCMHNVFEKYSDCILATKTKTFLFAIVCNQNLPYMFPEIGNHMLLC